ncbi:MAG: hypothetical protein ACK4V2_03915 [Pseudomonadota bacterium]|jgi:sugar lactone lactonase YvrE
MRNNKNNSLIFYVLFGLLWTFNSSAEASYDVSTIAGGGVYPGDGGSPTIAAVVNPMGVFVDSNNTTYIADTSNNRIRMVWGPASNGTYIQGNIYTIAGTGASGFSGDGGLATSALLSAPRSVKVDSAGNIFVADSNNNRIRKFTLGGNISTVAGGNTGDAMPATSSSIYNPSRVFLDALNNLYIADTNNHRIRMVWGAASNSTYTQGNIYTIAGTGTQGFNGDGIAATSAFLSSPKSVFVDALNNIYVADQYNCRIRKFTLGGAISTVAGNGGYGFGGDGVIATSTSLTYPQGISLDGAGNIYIADQNNQRIRMVWNAASNGMYTQGRIYTVAGNGSGGFNGDGGLATSTWLNSPTDVFVDALNNIYVADSSNYRLRKFTLGGAISTVAGNGAFGFGGDGGVATSAWLPYLQGISVDNAGNIYIADYNNQRIRMVWNAASNGTYTQGYIYTVAGNGNYGFNNDAVAATSAWLASPQGVFASNAGDIYIADSNNNRIRKFQLGGNISTIAGNGNTAYTGDGGLAINAGLSSPRDLCFDSAGNIYITDQSNNRIRMVWGAASNATYTQGRIYTVAGTGTNGFNGDGIAATSAMISPPIGITIDNAGNIYFADQYNCRIRKFTLGGAISTVVGTGGYGFNGDGIAATSASLAYPQGISVDGAGNIYIADQNNQRIRMVWNAASNGTYTQGRIYTVAGNGNYGFNSDGIAATSAWLASPQGVFASNAGVYIADSNNQRVRKFTLGGSISTIAGNGTTTFTGDGGLANVAVLNNPRGIVRDSVGNTYFADTNNNRIRKIDASTGIITTIAGGSGGSHLDGVGTAARFMSPGMMSIDNSGNLLIADSDNTIRKVTTSGGVYNVSTLFTYNVGSPPVQAVCSYLGNQLLTTDNYMHLYRWVQSGSTYVSNSNLDAVSGPAYDGYGLVVDSNNNIFVADGESNRIFKVFSD